MNRTRQWGSVVCAVLLGVLGVSAENVLPAGYTRLAYIASSGSQWIETNCEVSPNCTVEMDFGHPTLNNDTAMFGVDRWAGDAFLLTIQSSSFRFYGGGDYFSTPACQCLNDQDYHVSVNDKNGFAVTLGQSRMYTAATKRTMDASIKNKKLAIFGMNTGAHLSSFRFYNMQVCENGVLKCDLVPVLNPDHEPGLYDFVTATFFANKGSGDFTYALPETWAAGTAHTGVWTGSSDATKFSLAQNWYTKDVEGTTLRLTKVPSDDVPFVELQADADWRSMDLVDLPGYRVVDLKGHKLQVTCRTNPTAATKFTDTVGGGELQVTVPAGVEVNNTTLGLAGGLRFIKLGEGSIIFTKTYQSNYGGVVIREGTLKIGTSGIYGSLGGESAEVVVEPNGTLDVNGAKNNNQNCIVLAGGHVVNNGAAVPQGNGCFTRVRLTADSYVGGKSQFGFVGWGGGHTRLELNGHTLNVGMETQATPFHVLNNWADEGTVHVTQGTFWSYGGSDYSHWERVNLICDAGTTIRSAKQNSVNGFIYVKSIQTAGTLGTGNWFYVKDYIFDGVNPLSNGALGNFDAKNDGTANANSGKVTVKCSGQLQIGDGNTCYTGGLDVQSGSVKAIAKHCFGRGGMITLAPGTWLDINGQSGGYTAPATIVGDGNGNGAIQDTSSAAPAFGNAYPVNSLTLVGDASLGCANNLVFINASYGAITWNLDKFTLTKKGAGRLYAANTTVNGTGSLVIKEGAFAAIGTVTVNTPIVFKPGSNLDLSIPYASKGATFAFKNVTLETGAVMTGSSSGATLKLMGTFNGASYFPCGTLELAAGTTLKLAHENDCISSAGHVNISGAATLDVSPIFAHGEPSKDEITVLTAGEGFALNGGENLTVTGHSDAWRVTTLDHKRVRLIKKTAVEPLPACVETTTVAVNGLTVYDFPAGIGSSLTPGVYDLARWTTPTTGYGTPTLKLEGCPYEAELICGATSVKLLVKSPEQSAAKPTRIWMIGDDRLEKNASIRSMLFQKLALEGWNVKATGFRSTNTSDPSGAAMRPEWQRHNAIGGMSIKTHLDNMGFLEGLESYAMSAEDPEFTVIFLSTWCYWNNNACKDGTKLPVFWRQMVDRVLARFPNTTVVAVVAPTDTFNQTDAAAQAHLALQSALASGIRSEVQKNEASGGFPAGRVVLCDLDSQLTPSSTLWTNNWQYQTAGDEAIAELLKATLCSVANFRGRTAAPQATKVRNSLEGEPTLSVLYNKPLAAVPVTATLTGPEGAVTLANGVLDADGRVVTYPLATALTGGADYTLALGEVADGAGQTTSSQSIAFTGRALGLAANVPVAYTAGYEKLATIELPTNVQLMQDVGLIPYTEISSSLPLKGVKKAAWYFEAIEKESGELVSMWIDADAPGTSFLDITLPVTGAQQKQQPLTSLHVWANTRAVRTIAANDNAQKGFIEWNCYNYSATAKNVTGSTAAFGSTFDWNDTFSAAASTGHGCFQFFRMFANNEDTLAAEALFTYNRWGNSHTDGEGFGFGTFADSKKLNKDNWTLDRTFLYGADGSDLGRLCSFAYTLRRIEIYAQYDSADTREVQADATWTGETDTAFGTLANWTKDGAALASFVNKAVLLPTGTTTAFTYPAVDPTSLSSTTLFLDGTAAFNDVGAFYLMALDMGATGRFVFDPAKTTFRFGVAPKFADGAKIALAAKYASATKGRFLLCTFNRGHVAGPANLTDIFDTASARGANPRVWETFGADGTGYLWLDLDATENALTPVRVMCVGDSITHGSDSSYGNWRIPLMKKLNAAGFNPTATGYRNDQSHDEAGATMPEQWIWHSGVGGRRLITGGGGGVQDALETEIDQAGDVDVLLLKIGTNDINSDGTTAEKLFTAWTNTVLRMLAQSSCKVVAGAIVHINDATKNAQVTAFNQMAKAAIEGGQIFPAGRVFFADLYGVCPRFDANGDFIPGSFQNTTDLHPDWLGEDAIADEYARVIQLAMANGVPSTPAVEPTTSGCENNVPQAYRQGFKLARVIDVLKKQDLTAADAVVPYEDHTGNEGATEDLARVGYYIELKRANTAITDYRGRVRWMWVDMNAFGDRDIDTCGLPLKKWAQQTVSALHVVSNMPGVEAIPADDNEQTGFVEFWPFNYDAAASGVAGAPANTFQLDWNDKRSTSGTYGSMQVHRILPAGSRLPAQVMFGYNAWRSATGDRCIGLGTYAHHSNSMDWTHVYNAEDKTLSSAAYEVARIEIWTRGVADEQASLVWRPATATTDTVTESVAAWQDAADASDPARVGFQMGGDFLFDGTEMGPTTITVPHGLVANSVTVTGTKGYTFTGNGQIVADHVTYNLAAGTTVTLDGAGIGGDDVKILGGTVKVGPNVMANAFGVGANGTLTIATGAQLDLNYLATASGDAKYSSLTADKEVHIAGAGPDDRGALVNFGGSPSLWYSPISRLVLDGDATVGGNARVDIRNTSWSGKMYSGATTVYGPGYTLTDKVCMDKASGVMGLNLNAAQVNLAKLVVAPNAFLGFEGTTTLTIPGGVEFYDGAVVDCETSTVNGDTTLIVKAGCTVSFRAKSGTSVFNVPVIVEEGATLDLASGNTIQFKGGFENHGSIRQNAGSHYFFDDMVSEGSTFTGEVVGGGQFVFGDPTSGKVPSFSLLDLTGAGAGNIWFRTSVDQTIDGTKYRVNAPNATVFMDAASSGTTIEEVPTLTVKDANWNFSTLRMGSSGNPGNLVIDGGSITCSKELLTVGGTDWKSGRIELKNGAKLSVLAANHGPESCAVQIASTTSKANGLENVVIVGEGCELAVPNGYFFNGWSGRYARFEMNPGSIVTMYGINGRRRYNGVNADTRHDSIFRMNGGTLNLGPGGFLHGYTAYSGKALSSEVLTDHIAESGPLFRLNAGTLKATADTVTSSSQISEGVDIVFGESPRAAGEFTINPNGYTLDLRGGIKGWSDVTVAGTGTFKTDPYTKGFANGHWKVEAGVTAKLDGAAGFLGGLELAEGANASVCATSTNLVEFYSGSFTWNGLMATNYMAHFTYYANDLYYVQRKLHSNGPNYQAFAYRGEFYVPADKAGTWWFYGKWDDIVKLQIDGQLVLDGNGTAKRVSTTLAEGWHPFVVYVNDGYGGKGADPFGLGYRVGSDGGTTATNYQKFDTDTLAMRPTRVVEWYSKKMAANWQKECANLDYLTEISYGAFDWMQSTNSVAIASDSVDTRLALTHNCVRGTFTVAPEEAGNWTFRIGYDDTCAVKIDGERVAGIQVVAFRGMGMWEATPGVHTFEIFFGDYGGNYGPSQYGGLPYVATLAVSVNGTDFVPFDEAHFSIGEATFAGLAGESLLADGATLTNTGAAAYPITGTVFGSGTLDGQFCFREGWIGVTGGGSHYESVAFANAAADTFADLGGVECRFTSKPTRGLYCLGNAMGMTDAKARQLPVVVSVSNGGNYNYGLHATGLHCEVRAGKLYLVDDITVSTFIFLR